MSPIRFKPYAFSILREFRARMKWLSLMKKLLSPGDELWRSRNRSSLADEDVESDRCDPVDISVLVMTELFAEDIWV